MVWLFALGSPSGARVPREESARGSLVRVVQLAVPVTLAVLAAAGWAAARPTPAHSVPTVAEIERASPLEAGATELEGEAGLRVVRTDHGVRIETADGGGAGDVDLGTWLGGHDPTVGVTEDGEGWVVVATGNAGRSGFGWDSGVVRRAVRFDRQGVRTDDAILDRIAARFGRLGLALLGLALVLLVPFGLVLARGVGSAALLDRPSADATWVAWQGALELDDDAKLAVEKGILALEGTARVVRDGGESVVSLTTGAPVLGDAALVPGTRVAVVAPKRLLGELGLRTGAIAWPEGAWLVAGTLEAAKRRIAETSLRGAARFGVPAAFAAVLSAIVSLFG